MHGPRGTLRKRPMPARSPEPPFPPPTRSKTRGRRPPAWRVRGLQASPNAGAVEHLWVNSDSVIAEPDPEFPHFVPNLNFNLLSARMAESIAQNLPANSMRPVLKSCLQVSRRSFDGHAEGSATAHRTDNVRVARGSPHRGKARLEAACFRDPKTISDAGLAHDVFGIGGILFNLLAKCANVRAKVL